MKKACIVGCGAISGVHANALSKVSEAELYAVCDINKERADRLSKKYNTDGIILVLPSDICDIRMRIFNADGSEAEMCGNGARCVARYAVDKGIVNKPCITLETGAGIKKLYPITENGVAGAASVSNTGSLMFDTLVKFGVFGLLLVLTVIFIFSFKNIKFKS